MEKDIVILHNVVVEMVTIPARKVIPANGTIVYPEDFSVLQEYTPAKENFCKKIIDTYRQLTYEYLLQSKSRSNHSHDMHWYSTIILRISIHYTFFSQKKFCNLPPIFFIRSHYFN